MEYITSMVLNKFESMILRHITLSALQVLELLQGERLRCVSILPCSFKLRSGVCEQQTGILSERKKRPEHGHTLHQARSHHVLMSRKD
eukprot:1154088-Pelagomonas_calceolata.AAC.6